MERIVKKRQKTYLLTCEPSDDSNQPSHLQSNQNLHWAHFGELREQIIFMHKTKTLIATLFTVLKITFHYENMPIQIYRKFYLQKLKIFR